MSLARSIPIAARSTTVSGGPGATRINASSSRLTTYAAPSGANPMPDGARTPAITVRPRRRRVAEHLVAEHVGEPERAVVPPQSLGVGETRHHDLGLVRHA